MPEEPVEEAVESHEGPRSESAGQPPPEVGNLSFFACGLFCVICTKCMK
jgi:hypothetical protein